MFVQSSHIRTNYSDSSGEEAGAAGGNSTEEEDESEKDVVQVMHSFPCLVQKVVSIFSNL